VHLFQIGNFSLHSGANARWRIECDALSLHDWVTLALMIREILPLYSRVEGVPRGGIVLAGMLEPYATGQSEDPLLIVDDVWTTGDSMTVHRNGRDAIGAVVFARKPVDSWVTALFTMAQIS